MRKTIVFSVFSAAILILPLLADAQTGTLQGIVGTFGTIVRSLIGILFTLAIVAFFWGLVLYLFKDGKEGKGSGLRIMLMGIIAIFVMASLYGIVGILQRTLGAGGNAQFTAPSVQ